MPIKDIRDTAALYRVLTAMMDNAVALVDLQGRVIGFNKAAHERLGYTREEFEGINIADFDIEQGERDVVDTIQKIVSEHAPVSFLTKHRHRRNGTVLDVEVTAQAMEIGGRVLIQAVWEDVTELIEAKEALRNLLAIQTQFIQNVAHELRTPLALIRGYADMLQAGHIGELTEGQQNAINIVQRRSHELGNMVNDIIAVLEIEDKGGEITRDFRPINLSLLTRQIVNDFVVLAEKAGVTITVEADEINTIFGDVSLVQQAIGNVVNNAIKFTPRGGLVFVQVDSGDGGRRHCVTVRDTGIGIEKKNLDRIFDRFFQVDASDTRRYGGSGLGLAVVKDILEAHGGHVYVSSKPGKGTEFQLFFPTVEEECL